MLPHRIAASRLLFYGLILALPFTDFSFSPENLRSGGQPSVLLVLLLALAYLAGIRSDTAHRLRIDRTTGWFLVFVGVCFISTAIGWQTEVTEYRGEVSWTKSLKQFLQLVLSGAIYVLTVAMVRTRDELQQTLKVWYFAILGVITYGCLELLSWAFGAGFLSNALWLLHLPDTPWSGENFRLRLLAPEPSMAVNLLLVILPFVALGAFTFVPYNTRLRLTGLAVLMIALTFSLSGYVALLLGVIAGLAMFRKLLFRHVAVVVVVSALLFSIPAVQDAFSGVTDRLSEVESDNSIRARMADLQAGLNTFSSSPIVGVGLGNSMFYFERDYPDWAISDPYVRYLLDASALGEADLTITNLPVRLLAETGAIGFLTFFFWQVSLWRNARWCLEFSYLLTDRALALALMMSLILAVAHYMAMPGFHLRYLFFLFGLVHAWYNLRRQEVEDSLKIYLEAVAADRETRVLPFRRGVL